MAENLGSIRYDVSVDTAQMLKAEGTVNKSVATMVTSFDKADAAVRQFTNTQTKMGRTINSMGQVLNANGKLVVNATNQYRSLASTAQSSFTGLKTQINGVSAATRSAMPNMTNMSYQIQDIAVQAQMGTSPLVIFAQQFPQMAVGMGAAAGAIGAAVAILGALGTAVIDTSTSMDRLQKAIEKVQAVITIGAGGVANYSEEMQKLNAISAELTKIKLQNALAEQSAALKESAGAMRDAWKEAGTLSDQTSSGVIGEIISDKDQKKLKELAKDFNSGKISAEEFNKEVGNIKAAMSGVDLIDKGIKNLGYSSKEAQEEGVKQLVEGLGLLSGSAAQNTKAGRELTSAVTDLVVKYKEGKLTLDALRDSLNGTTDSFDKNAGTIKNLTNEFVLNAIRLSEGERAAFKFGLQLQGLDDDQVKAQLSLYDYNKELEKTKTEAEESARAIKDVNDSLDAFFDKESRDSTKKDEQETQSNITFAQSVINKGKSPDQLMAEQYERLKVLRDSDLENAQLYQEAMTALEIQAQENRENALAESYQRIGEQAASSMGEYLAGVKTAEEATRDLAATIITQAINSLVQMGTTALIQSATTTTAATTGIAATTGAAVTSTGVMAGAQTTAMTTVAGAVGTIAGGLATAWAPAAAFASLATLGTNAAPAIAGIYSTMAATLGAQLVGGLISSGIEAGTGFAGANMSGGREFGGPVSSGSMYRVGEKGKPEFYKDNLGNLSMIPGENGEVIPASKMGGSGSGMTVNISNNTPYEVFVTQDQATSIANVQIGKEAGKLQRGRGNMYNAMKSGGNYSNNAKR